MPRAIGSGSLKSLVKGEIVETTATAHQQDQLVEFNLLSYRDAEYCSKEKATILIREYKRRTKKQHKTV